MDDKSNIAKGAEAYIKQQTGVDLSKHKSIELDEQGRIKVDKRNSVRIDHVACSNDLIKLAGIVPMPQKSRDIINLKIVNPGINMHGISLVMKLRSDEITAYEREGLNRIKDYLGKMASNKALSEAVDKYNKDNSASKAVDVLNLNKQGKKNSLLTPQTP